MTRLFGTISALLIVLVLLTAGREVAADEFSFDYQKIIDLKQQVTLDMRLVRGTVRIDGGEDHRIIINAVKRVRASNYNEAQEVADHIEIKVGESGERVEIQTNYLRMINRGRSFWQKLLGSGSDSYGQVEYTITVPIQTTVKISSLSSEIYVSSIEGGLDIENETGTAKAEYIFGPVTVSQPHGDVDLQWIEGDIRVKATTGTIVVNQIVGALDIATHTGEVHIRTELDSPRDFFVETTSGEITFAIPPAASGELDVETASGGIKTDIPIIIKSVTRTQLVGAFGDGGPRIKLTTSSGDVTVAQF